MQPTLPRLRHISLTFDQHLHLARHFAQTAQNLFIPVHKAEDLVLDARVLAELSDQHLQSPQVMPRHAREEMVHGLELQAAVDEVEPGGTGDVHGGAELLLREALRVAEVGGAHREVGERDLHVQGHGDDVGDEDEGDAEGPGRDGAPEEEVAEEVPVAEHEGDFGRAGPGRGAEVGGAGGEQVQPGEEVEVEAGDAHDRVVRVMLDGDGEGGELVEDEGEVVVARMQGVEEGGGCGE